MVIGMMELFCADKALQYSIPKILFGVSKKSFSKRSLFSCKYSVNADFRATGKDRPFLRKLHNFSL